MRVTSYGFDGQLALPSKPVTLIFFKCGVRSSLNYYNLVVIRPISHRSSRIEVYPVFLFPPLMLQHVLLGHWARFRRPQNPNDSTKQNHKKIMKKWPMLIFLPSYIHFDFQSPNVKRHNTASVFSDIHHKQHSDIGLKIHF
jgi:hypothetical protein